MRVATYNIKHGGLKGAEAIAGVLSALDADLIGLQEVDVGVGRSDDLDQALWLGERLGLQVAFGPAFPYGGGHYGVALLCRWPIAAAEVMPLPSLAEPRVLLLAEVARPEGALVAAVTHFGLQPHERQAQARAVAARLARYERLVLVGDFNASYSEPSLELLRRQGLRDAATELGLAPLRTYPSAAPTIGIDHVLLGGSMPPPARVRVERTDASDHLPVVVELG